MFGSVIDWIVGAAVFSAVSAVGLGIYEVFNDYYKQGKLKEKLDEVQKELADAKAKADTMAEQRTSDDTQKRLDNGNF
jgi:uncharacterized membrane protein (DUF106 family)